MKYLILFLIYAASISSLQAAPSVQSYLTDVHFKVSKVVENGEVVVNKILVNTSFDLSKYNIIDSQLTNTKSFGSESTISKINNQEFIVEGSGTHKILLQETAPTKVVVWKQLVYVPYPKPDNHYQLAQKYMPITAYSDKTAYFPQRIEKIFKALDTNTIDLNNPNIEMNIPNFTGKNIVFTKSDDLLNFMAEKGHLDSLLHFNADPSRSGGAVGIPFLPEVTALTCTKTKTSCKPLALRNSFGKQRPLTLYYTAAEINNVLYLTYIYIYAFDMKTGTYIAPGPGSHVLDRESLTLILTKNNDQWQPESVVYGAHLDSQNMTFKGCLDNKLDVCKKDGSVQNDSVILVNGKTKLEWSKAPKLGKHLIVYPAQGSNALFPTYGRYVIETFTTKLNELAGNITDKYTFYPNDYELIELNYYNNVNNDETNKQLAFAFSGFWVDGALKFNSRFPPFIRSPKFWTASASSPFNSCNTASCAPYFPTPPLGIQKHAEITGRVIDTFGILDISYGGSEYYKTKTDKNGYFSLIVPAFGIESLVIKESTRGERQLRADKINLQGVTGRSKDLGDIKFDTLDDAFTDSCFFN